MVAITRLNVTLYVHWLSCWNWYSTVHFIACVLLLWNFSCYVCCSALFMRIESAGTYLSRELTSWNVSRETWRIYWLLNIMFIGPCIIVIIENKRPTWCHLLFYFTSNVLNMFRTLIYPSWGACDYSIELPHWSYCSWFDVCWRFSVVGLEAEACNTDTTPTQPHRNSNTNRTKNNRPMW